MSWKRIETMGRSLDLDEGVKARIADPFWMMGRQWQVGEFRGDDASQPVSAEMEVETLPVQTLRNGTGGEVQRIWDPKAGHVGPPLEARIETVAPGGNGFSGTYRSAQIGRELADILRAAGQDDLADELARHFPFDALPEPLAGSGRARAAMRLMRNRAINGQAALLDRDGLLDRHIGQMDDATQADNLGKKVKAWRARHSTPDPAWSSERLEYGCSIAARSAEQEIVLSAKEHPGGPLDWYQFDYGTGSHGLKKRDAHGKTTPFFALPTPVSYSGMPAARWWEIEDHRVHMGDIQAGPTDFARLMVAEFATSYSDDWFVVPLRVPRGTISRVKKVTVHDNFAQDPISIQPVAVLDALELVSSGSNADRAFRLFELSGDPGPAAQVAPWLLIAPTLASSMEGPALERVVLARDEGANLAWAIERTVEGPMGRAFDRGTEWFARPEAQIVPRKVAGKMIYEDQTWGYRLASEMPPPWWIPFLPERIDEDGSMRLRRGRMHQWDDMDGAATGCQGGLLGTPGRPFYIEEEEVPRSGVTLSRNWQVARGADGGLYLWMQNTKRPGRGERSSGLRWDILEE